MERPANTRRVDDWDEEAGADEVVSAPAGSPLPPAPPVADASAASASGEAPVAAPTEAADPALNWRQVITAAPPWIWLISIVAMGALCAMFFTVVFLMVLLK